MEQTDQPSVPQPQPKKTKKRRNRNRKKAGAQISSQMVAGLPAGLGLLGQPRMVRTEQMQELFHVAYESLSPQDREKARAIYKLAKTDAARVMDAFQAIFGLARENGRGAAVFTDPGRDEGPLLKAMYQMWVEKCKQIESSQVQNGLAEEEEGPSPCAPAPFSLDPATFLAPSLGLDAGISGGVAAMGGSSIQDLAAAAASLHSTHPGRTPTIGQMGPPAAVRRGLSGRGLPYYRPSERGNGHLNEAERQVAEICMHLPILKQAVMQNYGEGTANLVSQIEVLLKSREPTASQARELFKLLLTPQFCSKDTQALEAQAWNDAEVASAPAIVALAFIYDGTDDRQAVRHYLQAAQFDDSIACMQLGAKYLRGEGVRADNALAYRWYLRAAELSNPIAQHKVGYFNDEGLEGVCGEDLGAAVHWYTEASELIPDSLHNLAKIYEDGRGQVGNNNTDENGEGGEPGDISRAVHLYSVAAARGFSLSQVNLGRLFLLGEKGVARDREAGRRLLVLAAESGDCDAQMVVGMIHATPAFDAYDLPAAELWLRRSLSGGKSDAQRLLARVQQQMSAKGLESLSDHALPGSGQTGNSNDDPGSLGISGGVLSSDLSLNSQMSAEKTVEAAAAAAVRGDDFRRHALHEAAVLEYTRAWETDPSQPRYLVLRVQSLLTLELFEECLPDCTALLAATSTGAEDQAAQDAAHLLGRALVNAYWCSEIRYNLMQNLSKRHRSRVVKHILGMLLDHNDETAKAAAFIARLTSGGPQLCKAVLAEGGIPMIVTTLEQSNDEQVLTHCAGAIINFTQQTHQITALVACDVIPILVHQARNGNPRPAFSAIQALGNMAVLANEETWQLLLDADLPGVFDSVIRTTYDQIQQLKELLEHEGGAGAVAAAQAAAERFHQAQLVASDRSGKTTPAEREAAAAAAMGAAAAAAASSAPDQVQVALTDLLSASSLTLARVLQRCPDGFVSALVALDLMGPLREVFQARVLPQQLRSGTAFALCRLLLAKERHARDLLKQSVERFANCRDARDILARGGDVFQEISENAKDNPEVMDSVLRQLETMGRMLSRNFADEKEAVDSTFLLTTYNFHVGTSSS